MSVALEAALAMFGEKNHPGIMQTSAEQLITILSNIASDPAEKKFRKLKPTNRLMAEKVLPAKGSKPLLLAVGFEQVRGAACRVPRVPRVPPAASLASLAPLVLCAASRIRSLLPDAAAALRCRCRCLCRDAALTRPCAHGRCASPLALTLAVSLPVKPCLCGLLGPQSESHALLIMQGRNANPTLLRVAIDGLQRLLTDKSERCALCTDLSATPHARARANAEWRNSQGDRGARRGGCEEPRTVCQDEIYASGRQGAKSGAGGVDQATAAL
jgi:hypothetical protein